MRKTRLGMALFAAWAAILLAGASPADAKAKAKEPAKAAAASRVDLNSASQAELEALPGVGAATAKKIIAGRPYSSVADLSKAGVSAKTIEKLGPLVTVGGAAAVPKTASAEKPMKAGKTAATAAPSGPVDINAASQKELEALPGVGAATAKKIIAGRPYSSVADLSKAGVSAGTIRKLSPLVTVGGAAAALPARAGRAAAPAAPSGLVDVNTASQKDLEALPGVGAATAKKIIAGRPYSSVADLSKAGVSAGTIQKLAPLVTVGGAAAALPTRAGRATAPAAASGLVDLNTASQKELEALPGVGVATAKKIIAGRPYASVSDLARAGVSAKTIGKLAPLVTAGAAASSASAIPSAPARRGEAVPAPAAPSPSAQAPPAQETETPTPQVRTPPSAGMVWVNTATKIYHREGDPWYGRTKQGKFMTEPDAMKAGYRASKQSVPKK